MMMSIHNQFMDESGGAGVEAAGTDGTVTFFLSESTLRPVTDADGAVTPFVMSFTPETLKVGKVIPLSKFCVPLRAIILFTRN